MKTPALTRVVDILHDNHKLTYAVVVEDPYTDPVCITIAKRGEKFAKFDTIQLEIPKDKFDPFTFLELVEKHQPPQSIPEPENDPCCF
jgi:hypothetical protein